MRIGFDGKRVVQNFTGLGNYSRYVLGLLACVNPENEYWVYCPKKASDNIASELEKQLSIAFRYPAKKTIRSLWRSFGMISDLKKDQIDIFHGLSNEIPFGITKHGIPTVVTIHDLIFLRYPEYFPFIDRNIYAFKFRYACTHANKIIAVSEQTKRDIIHFFNIPAARIEVIYQDCDPVFRQKATEQQKEKVSVKYNLPKKFLLNVGTIESRKNVLLICQALKNVDSSVHLVVIGKETAYTSQVKSYLQNVGLMDRVLFLTGVPLVDLPAIYQQAELFIYPSKFEGFGIPVVEALHSGIPVIAAKGSCLEEAGGPHSIYIDPNSAEQLSDAVNQLLHDSEKRTQMIKQGLAYVERFDAEKIAKQLMAVYEDVVKAS
jgi:glycosyltransferase involved in cell wall biosynthesis